METAAQSVVELGKYGVVGVMLALIILCAFAIWMLWKFATNHVQHSNKAFNENTAALTSLQDLIKYKLKLK